MLVAVPTLLVRQRIRRLQTPRASGAGHPMNRRAAMRRRLLLALAALLATAPAQADHHLLKRALQQAGCIPRATTQVLRDGARAIYDVTCLGPDPDRVTIVCTGRVCLPDNPDHHDLLDEIP
ncbi:hypothetical protein [Methylobacterium nodulans]|nr:hypothetical protein [Methylobacterium nodulans]